MLFDTHVHFSAFPDPAARQAALDRAAAAGVDRLLAVGGSPPENLLALAAAEANPGRVWAATGYDRDQAEADPSPDELRGLLSRPEVVAVGEIGLDYHYHPETAARQRGLMERQLALARELRRPVIVHSREAEEDTAALLGTYAAGLAAPGVLHCFTGSQDFAARLLEIGFHISFSGIVTFANAGRLRDVARSIPDDRLLVETDTPYLAPVPHRGQGNEPAFVACVAEALAKIRNDTLEHIAHITARNAEALFGLAKDGKP